MCDNDITAKTQHAIDVCVCIVCTRRKPNEWTCELCVFMSPVCNRRTQMYGRFSVGASWRNVGTLGHPPHIVIYTHRHKTPISTIKDYKLNWQIRCQFEIIVIKFNTYLLVRPPECAWASRRSMYLLISYRWSAVRSHWNHTTFQIVWGTEWSIWTPLGSENLQALAPGTSKHLRGW